MTARLIVATVHEGLASLEEGSVDLVLSSPPFLALRSYLPKTHPTKHREIGSETTPADFLTTLLDVVEACDRVLAPHGSLVFELGDTFAGSGGAGGDYNTGGLRDGQERFNGAAARAHAQKPHWRSQDGTGRRQRAADEDAGILPPTKRPGPEGRDRMIGWPLDKSLTMMPSLFAASLAYGRNLLRPERTTAPWRIRNVIAWCRPNPPVGALADKVRSATSYLTVACKSRTRYWDMDAVRTAAKVQMGRPVNGNNLKGSDAQSHRFAQRVDSHPAGAPLLDWWEIPTEPYKGNHYATWPSELVRRCVLLMCPESVCRECGEPRRRNVQTDYVVPDRPMRDDDGRATIHVTLGWTDCGHNDYRRGVVLDPFAGSGTTLAVAQGHGRDAIGIDLDSRNADLARGRVGMFLTVEYPTTEREEVEA